MTGGPTTFFWPGTPQPSFNRRVAEKQTRTTIIIYSRAILIYFGLIK